MLYEAFNVVENVCSWVFLSLRSHAGYQQHQFSSSEQNVGWEDSHHAPADYPQTSCVVDIRRVRGEHLPQCWVGGRTGNCAWQRGRGHAARFVREVQLLLPGTPQEAHSSRAEEADTSSQGKTYTRLEEQTRQLVEARGGPHHRGGHQHLPGRPASSV